MRRGRLTPNLDIVITETGPSGAEAAPYRVLLFRGYPGRRVRIDRRLLRLAGRHPWGGVLAALVLRTCRKELTETILACDLDMLDVTGVTWGRWVRRALEGQFPQWFPGRNGSHGRAPGSWRTLDETAKVTVVLPVFNAGPFFHQSVESCLRQTHRNLELVIVDDGSADDIAPVLQRYDDRRIRLLRHSENRGIAAALNTGFAAATGDFLTWTSNDNYYDPRAIETMIGFLQTYPGIDFVYSDMHIIEENDAAPIRIREARPPAWFRVQESNPVGACFLYRRRVFDALGGDDSRAFLAEDYEYLLRVASRFRMQRLCRPLYHYRYHGRTLTAKHDRSEVLARVRQVRRQHGVPV